MTKLSPMQKRLIGRNTKLNRLEPVPEWTKTRNNGHYDAQPSPQYTQEEMIDPDILDAEQVAFSKMKYIVVNHPRLGEIALMFPNIIIHYDMKRRMFPEWPLVSAGFVNAWPDGLFQVYGRSESLNCDSRQDKDPEVIKKSLGMDF